jgi:AcrR family transcriptional regulator
MNERSFSDLEQTAAMTHVTPDMEANGKEDRILRAAVQVFAEHGYHGSTMAMVAQQAEVATGTIYLYFVRKQDLLITLFQRHLGEYLERSKPALADAEDGVPRLRLLTQTHLAFFAEDRARDLDVRVARHVFFGAVDEVVTGWVRSKRDHPLMSALDPLATMLARAFGAALPGAPS